LARITKRCGGPPCTASAAIRTGRDCGSGPLAPIRTLRNRIAHHEPIIAWNLPRHYAKIIELTGWLCPSAAEWCEAHSRFREAYPPEGIVLRGDGGPE